MKNITVYAAPSCETAVCEEDLSLCLAASILSWGDPGDAGSDWTDLEDTTF